jgi:hypothetical protein
MVAMEIFSILCFHRSVPGHYAHHRKNQGLLSLAVPDAPPIVKALKQLLKCS